MGVSRQNLYAHKPLSSPAVPANAAPRVKNQSSKNLLGLPGAIGNQAVQRILRMGDFLPQTRGTDAGHAMVHPASPVANRGGVNAVTSGGAVHLSPGLPQRDAAEQQRVLAHEAVHLAQNSSPGPSAPREMLEMEANHLSADVLAGNVARPHFHADAGTALADEDGGPLPGDRIAVAKAKARREILLRYKERQEILGKRKRLDDSMKKMLQAVEAKSGQKGLSVEDYRNEEQSNLALMNKKPVTLEMTATTVRIRARFQVRFEGLTDKEAKAKFPVLEKNFKQGVRDTWDQELKGAVLKGRTFEFIPELHLVSATAKRDKDYWLITVRPKDDSPMVYEGTSLGAAPGGDPTAATDPTLDGGVMSLPPVIVGLPKILGHETLHLFSMVDRYVIIPAALSPTHQQEDLPLRDTQGRTDPLGEAEGKILEEDLGFVLDEFDVYPTGSESDVLKELNYVDDIIKKGRDPNSLINKRKDFNREMVKQTEDLD